MNDSVGVTEHREADGRTEQAVVQALISPERAEKFHLLLHLLVNVTQGIVVCGPKGIGTTTVLRLVQGRVEESMTVCRIDASTPFDLSAIQKRLLAAVGVSEGVGESVDAISERLSNRLRQLEKAGQRVVFLVDQAGGLMPGLVSAICRLSVSHPALRPVFAMTSDDLQIKCSTDPIIDTCHVIDIPPLSEAQCGEFLKNLSGKPDNLLQFAAITSQLVEKVYQDTHGVPGRIVAALPAISAMKLPSVTPKVVPIESVVLGIVIVAGALFWLWTMQDSDGVGADLAGLNKSRSGNVRTPVQLVPSPSSGTDPSMSQPQRTEEATGSRVIAPERSVVVSSSADRPEQEAAGSVPRAGAAGAAGSGDTVAAPAPAEDVANRGVVAAAVPAQSGGGESMSQSTTGDSNSKREPAATDAAAASAVADNAAPGPMPKEPDRDATGSVSDESAEPKAVAGVEGAKALLSRNSDRYTLQLLAVRQREALEQFVKKHPQLHGLSFFRFKRDGLTWYALLYGDYPSLAAARRAAKTLPKSFRTPWPRKLNSIQKQIRTKGE